MSSERVLYFFLAAAPGHCITFCILMLTPAVKKHTDEPRVYIF